MATGELNFKEQEMKIIDSIRELMEQIADRDKNHRNTEPLYQMLEQNLKKYENLRKSIQSAPIQKGTIW